MKHSRPRRRGATDPTLIAVRDRLVAHLLTAGFLVVANEPDVVRVLALYAGRYTYGYTEHHDGSRSLVVIDGRGLEPVFDIGWGDGFVTEVWEFIEGDWLTEAMASPWPIH